MVTWYKQENLLWGRVSRDEWYGWGIAECSRVSHERNRWSLAFLLCTSLIPFRIEVYDARESIESVVQKPSRCAPEAAGSFWCRNGVCPVVFLTTAWGTAKCKSLVLKGRWLPVCGHVSCTAIRTSRQMVLSLSMTSVTFFYAESPPGKYSVTPPLCRLTHKRICL